MSVGNGRQGEPTGDTGNSCPAHLLNTVQQGDQLVRIPPEGVSADTNLPQTCCRTKSRAVACDSTTEDRRKDGNQDGLLQTQPELPTQKSRGEARRVHGAARPQQRHSQLFMPRDMLLVLWAFAVDGFRFNTEAPIHAQFQLTEPRHGPAILGDRCVVVFRNRHRLYHIMGTFLVGEVASLTMGGLRVERHVEMPVLATRQDNA